MKKIITLVWLLTAGITNIRAQQFDFANQFGGTLRTQCRAMTQDIAGNIFITGQFSGTTDLDPTNGTLNVTSSGADDIFVIKLNSSGNMIWAKTYGGPDYDIPSSICIDPEGNVIIVGTYSSSIDVDPETDVYNLTSNGDVDIFVQKLTSDGDLMWGLSVGGSASDYVYSVTTDSGANIIVGGSFRNTVDFNPGAGENALTAFDFPDAFVWKLSSSGNYIWAKSFSGSAEDLVADLAVDDTDRITAIGTFYETTDFDPSNATFNFTSTGSADIYVAQLESNGTFVTAKKIGGFGTEVPGAMILGDDGALYFTGYYQLTVDFDPDAGVDQLSAQGPYEIFVSKWNNDGTYAWAKGFKGSQIMNKGNDIFLDSQNNVLTTGYYSGNTDFDPGAGIAQIGNVGGTDFYINKLSNEGNYIWSYGFGASGEDWGIGITSDVEGGIYVAGYFDETIDFDPGAGNSPMTAPGQASSFVMKISEDECSNLSLGILTAHNSDCIDFHGEAEALASGGTEPYTYEWLDIEPTNETTIMPMEEGIYYVTVTDAIGCQRTTGAFVNGYDNPAFYNLEAYIAEGNFRPQINSTVNVIVFNHGCQPVDATVKLLLTPNCTFVSSDPPETQVVGDTIMWVLPQINWDSQHFMAKVKMLPDPSLPLYDSLCFKIFITPFEGDLDTTDNMDEVCYFFRFSYDPNDKQVSPPGDCDEGYTLMGEKLHYNIRFQNIGNAPAENVYILDTLSPYLDLNSFRVIAASHDMVTEILPGNVIKYRFDNINLPDSTSDFEGSQGYVFFSIDHLNDIVVNTAVKNSAAIYFDLNEPVITNQTLNTFVNSIPECTNSISDLTIINSSVLLYPNPATNTINIRVPNDIDELQIFNQFGQLMYYSGKSKQNEIAINTSSFSGGIYFLKVLSGNTLNTNRFVISAK